MTKVRALLFREEDQSVAVCLEHFVVGQGKNDMEALESLHLVLKTHEELGGLGGVQEAPEKYRKRFESSSRESTTARDGFVFQLRTG